MGERVRRGGIAVGVEDTCNGMREERIRQRSCWREWIKKLWRSADKGERGPHDLLQN